MGVRSVWGLDLVEAGLSIDQFAILAIRFSSNEKDNSNENWSRIQDKLVTVTSNRVSLFM